MLTVLAVLICYSLLQFGAVLPNSWFALTILWSCAIGLCLILAAFRRNSWDYASLILFLSALGLLFMLPPRLSIGLVAGIFAGVAGRNDVNKTLPFFKILIAVGVLEAVLGLFQFFISPGWIFGYINPSYRVSGTLINRN